MNNGRCVDQEVVGKLAEVDMIVADLERANSRIATVERRNVRLSPFFFFLARSKLIQRNQELLRAEIESIRTGSSSDLSSSTAHLTRLESQIAELESSSAKLSQALDTQKALTIEAEISAGKKVDEIGRELGRARGEVESLTGKLATYKDYDEIKRELEIMKV